MFLSWSLSKLFSSIRSIFKSSSCYCDCFCHRYRNVDKDYIHIGGMYFPTSDESASFGEKIDAMMKEDSYDSWRVFLVSMQDSMGLICGCC